MYVLLSIFMYIKQDDKTCPKTIKNYEVKFVAPIISAES